MLPKYCQRFVFAVCLCAVMLISGTAKARELQIVYPANGLYSIQSKCAPNKELTVQDASTTDGANVFLWSINSNWHTQPSHQKWRITRLDNSQWYKIEVENSGKALNVHAGIAQNGTNVSIWPYGGNMHQFRFLDAGGGYYVIQPNIGGSVVLDVNNGANNDGANVQVWTWNGTPAQLWKLVRRDRQPQPQPQPSTETLPNGWYSIHPAHDQGRALDAAGPSDNLHMWTNANVPQQSFYLQNRGNGYFSLMSKYKNLYISANGRGPGVNLSMLPWQDKAPDFQLFRLENGGKVAGKQTYHIVAKVGVNLNFDCAGGNRYDGNNAQLWTKETNSNWHKWIFTPAGATPIGYDEKVKAFRSDWRYADGSDTTWDCGAYAHQFVKYVYGISESQFGQRGKYFGSQNDIKSGDVIHVEPRPNVAENPHWIVVLYRDGCKLITIEGNWNKPKVNGLGRTRYSETTYTIQNGKLYSNGKEFRRWAGGYHYY